MNYSATNIAKCIYEKQQKIDHLIYRHSGGILKCVSIYKTNCGLKELCLLKE